MSAIWMECEVCGEEYIAGMVGSTPWPAHRCPLATLEDKILAVLDEDEGTDRHDLYTLVGGNGHYHSLRQISDALHRLHKKDLIHGGRWRETFVWFKRRNDEAGL